jgi:hypothetical protein
MGVDRMAEFKQEVHKLKEQFPEACRTLTEFGYRATQCQFPKGYSLHGAVVGEMTVFRRSLEVESSGSLFPLIPGITINAVITDTSSVKEVGVDYSVVFSTELYLGESNNLYLEHMQRYKDVDPMAVERLFVAAALLMQKH